MIRFTLHRENSRCGAVLLLITGIVAMLAVLATVFLARMRSDAQEVNAMLQMAQCRAMLHAGMAFIQESSRLGYALMNADGTTADAREAWGWIDTRAPFPGQEYSATPLLPVGQRYMLGPRDRTGIPLWTAGQWPDLGTVKRCPMYMKKRPPWAVEPTIAPNPIPSDPQVPATFGIPVFKRPDPLPALDRAIYPTAPSPSDAVARTAWSIGDPTPDPRSTGFAWFRVYRENGQESDRPTKSGAVGATFIITAGSGGTMGFKDWGELTAQERSDYFRNDQALFESQLAGEMRQWFRIEWSAAVSGGDNRHFKSPYAGDNNSAKFSSYYTRYPINASRHRGEDGPQNNTGSTEPRNYIGTIRYIERLYAPPSRW